MKTAKLILLLILQLTYQISFAQKGITAHRGNSYEYPENSIWAINSSLNAGFEWIEIDVHLTKDNQLVVIHDNTTQRVGNKNLVVSQVSYEELAQVDVFHSFRQQHNLPLAKIPVTKAPLLREVLELLTANNTSKISIQPKVDCVYEIVELVKSMNLTKRVGINDGTLSYLIHAKQLAPDLTIFWDRPANSDIDRDIQIALKNNFSSLVINHAGITPEKIAKSKKAKLEVGAWTVNDAETMQSLLKMGVERIYTDDPKQLSALMKDPNTVFTEGFYSNHVQGICSDDKGNIYWSWTTKIVKTDASGKILKVVDAPNHQGDLCYVNGKIYVAVNLGEFNKAGLESKSWVYEFDATSLELVNKYFLKETVFGAGGMAFHKDKFYVVGGLPTTEKDNHVYVYNTKFKFQKVIPLHSGYSRMGIQTIAKSNNYWWAGTYDSPALTYKVDKNFKLLDKLVTDSSLGIIPLSDDTFIIAHNIRYQFFGHKGYYQIKKF